jgi:hypothetical protein
VGEAGALAVLKPVVLKPVGQRARQAGKQVSRGSTFLHPAINKQHRKKGHLTEGAAQEEEVRVPELEELLEVEDAEDFRQAVLSGREGVADE